MARSNSFQDLTRCADADMQDACILGILTPDVQAKEIRPHVPIGSSRDDAHAIAIKLDEAKERITMAKLNRGDIR